MSNWKLDIGASVIDGGRTRFVVWAPNTEKLSVKIISNKTQDILPLKKTAMGYFEGIAGNATSGDRYLYILNEENFCPDPASRFQPEGVHGPSQVVDPYEFRWNDDGWKGKALEEFIIYELHVGTFTKDGTFESIVPYMDYLKELGVTAIELMPVAQFPGGRNWGYDGVYPFAPQNAYGGPAELKELVNAAHKKGFSVILDVVYNHLGPEGNYLRRYGPYFSDKYRTPWGDAINFDGPHSDEVRRFFISNALYWTTEYHIDALRIDAVHGIFDFSAKHILKELAESVRIQAEALGRNVYIIAESDLNDARVINPAEAGGYGLDAQWNDDFHHALHALLTGEVGGYYEDFGTVEQMGKAFGEGFVYSGQYSRFRKRRHGNSSRNNPANRFIVFSQSHDQVGNRAAGDRLSRTQSVEKLKLAAGVVLLSPYIPLLFMGEEYGETAPFQYFIDHSDEALVQAVIKGREKEFAWSGSEMPNPLTEDAFINSKLTVVLHELGTHRVIFEFYRKLIKLRKEIPGLRNLSKENMEIKCFEDEEAFFLRRWFNGDEVFCVFNFNDEIINVGLPLQKGIWDKILDSSSPEWGGNRDEAPQRIDAGGPEILFSPGPHSFVLYRTFNKGEQWSV